MSNSTHLALCDAIVALLLASPALASGNVEANRNTAMPQGMDSKVYVYLQDATPTAGDSSNQTPIGTIDWSTRIQIDCLARDTHGASAIENSDALQVAVFARLLSEPTLGGLAIDLENKAIAWTTHEADTSISQCQAIYSVWHQTGATSIAQT